MMDGLELGCRPARQSPLRLSAPRGLCRLGHERPSSGGDRRDWMTVRMRVRVEGEDEGKPGMLTTSAISARLAITVLVAERLMSPPTRPPLRHHRSTTQKHRPNHRPQCHPQLAALTRGLLLLHQHRRRHHHPLHFPWSSSRLRSSPLAPLPPSPPRRRQPARASSRAFS